MNININNYEEYFLLYVDNELSAADKNIVEAFANDNPDLQEELMMLQQSIVKPDAVEFTEKEKLLKAETINAATEEKLLLLLDNELGGKDKKQIVALIQKDKNVQQEWELLQQTKLSAADNIIFEDKVSLYKKENCRVVPIKWWHVAAAAVLIGFGMWGTASYFNKGTNAIRPSETANTKKTSAAETNTEIVLPFAKEEKNLADNNSDEKINTAVQTTETKKPVVKINSSKEVTQQKQEKNNNIVAAPNTNENIPVPENQDVINKEESNKNNIATVTPETGVTKMENVNESPVAPANSFASNASLKESKTYNTFDEDDEDRPKKSKVGSFFKRVKRVLERKTKIKTGSGDEVKIANMSFAIH